MTHLTKKTLNHPQVWKKPIETPIISLNKLSIKTITLKLSPWNLPILFPSINSYLMNQILNILLFFCWKIKKICTRIYKKLAWSLNKAIILATKLRINFLDFQAFKISLAKNNTSPSIPTATNPSRLFLKNQNIKKSERMWY